MDSDSSSHSEAILSFMAMRTDREAILLRKFLEEEFREEEPWTGDTTGVMKHYAVTLERVKEKMNNPNGRFMGVIHNSSEDMVGCFYVYKRTDTMARVANLLVDVESRGNGYASEMLEKAENMSRRLWGTTTVQLNVLSSQDLLIKWYEERGYERTGEEEQFNVSRFLPSVRTCNLTGLTLIVLEKRLPAAA